MVDRRFYWPFASQEALADPRPVLRSQAAGNFYNEAGAVLAGLADRGLTLQAFSRKAGFLPFDWNNPWRPVVSCVGGKCD